MKGVSDGVQWWGSGSSLTVGTSAVAGITRGRSGAAVGGRSLGRGIGDRVATVTSTLESVVEPNPVSDLMG